MLTDRPDAAGADAPSDPVEADRRGGGQRHQSVLLVGRVRRGHAAARTLER